MVNCASHGPHAGVSFLKVPTGHQKGLDQCLSITIMVVVVGRARREGHSFPTSPHLLYGKSVARDKDVVVYYSSSSTGSRGAGSAKGLPLLRAPRQEDLLATFFWPESPAGSREKSKNVVLIQPFFLPVCNGTSTQ